MASALSKRLDDIEDLPTIPHTMQQILSGIDSISSSAQSLQEIVKQDPVLTAKILKVANSSFYSPSTEIATVSRAIVNMGFDEVRDVVISLSLAGIFCDDLGFDEFKSTDLWLHSIGVATAAKLIANRVQGIEPDELYTAGILHDLGRLVYCLYFKYELRDVLGSMAINRKSLYESEESYGLTHSEMGAYLAQRWQLSDLIINVIRHHHKPQNAGQHTKAASVIFLADAITINLGIGWKGLDGPPKINIPNVLGLTIETIKEVVQQMREEKEKITSNWSDLISD
ncbi:MAG: HDOD domain-containing protein [Proteobacteria bacterium]|nr:HDOD domain-containing protein [Pseudomonadota bacterium]MBU1715837.1 HDOD domain-containing protein [Pseudomonadota bacterium]